ncbi:cytidine deaminase [Solihabitans fulvus]|uniref:Cytidine deaminase n=1 Tax=Solihabitans fulvus TaxID=1892852 RepID=A0A5B2X4S3_9PSEU|nr:cytidine deaminase [Solihabitans fulvus]KAA2258139.1 cytidine deaminase [Solihabitans fulvus]
MTTNSTAVDRELIEAASEVAKNYCLGENHTVASAARSRDGRIIVGVNVAHFNGGPCAELVLIGTAAARGAYDLDTIVAVGGRDCGVLPPCGRCRQVLVDYFPSIDVIIGTRDLPRQVSIAELLPDAYLRAG